MLFVNIPVADLERSKALFAKPIAGPTTHTLALYCFSVSSDEGVETVSAAALAACGSEADDAEDHDEASDRGRDQRDQRGPATAPARAGA